MTPGSTRCPRGRVRPSHSTCRTPCKPGRASRRARRSASRPTARTRRTSQPRCSCRTGGRPDRRRRPQSAPCIPGSRRRSGGRSTPRPERCRKPRRSRRWSVTRNVRDPRRTATNGSSRPSRLRPPTMCTSAARPTPPPPPDDVYVSALPFFSATNGWGPVERDTSNGEQAAGDGRPITLNGVVYQKGLGTNAVSDVSVYLGGNCSRFTAAVGVDDEQGSAGSGTFSVISDGKTLTTTPVLTGTSASINLDVDITGTQLLDLVVGDGGNGNGNDHGDWAAARLSCA